MNNSLSPNSFFTLPDCFDPNLGPGACVAPRGSWIEFVINTIYQKAANSLFVREPLCSMLKVKPVDCTGNFIFKPFAQLFSKVIPGYDHFDDSPQSHLNTFLTNLLRDFHLKAQPVQKKILSCVDNLFSLFVDCTSTVTEQASKDTFEANLIEAKKLASTPGDKTSALSKLLSHHYATTDKMLLHVLGDSFGKSTGLEGLLAPEAANHLIAFFSFKLIHDPQNKQIQQARDTLLETLEFSSNFYRRFFGDLCKQSLSDFFSSDATNAPCFNPGQLSRIKRPSQILRDKLNKLKEGKPLYLFGGWFASSEGPGHGMVYKFTKQKKSDLYSFEMINLGSGIEHHFKHYEKGVQKIIPYFGKKNISLDSLTSDTFVSAIHEIYTFYLDYDTVTSSLRGWSPEQLYTVLSNSILDGDPYTEHIAASDWVEPQHSGTCAFRSLIEIFGKEMTPIERARFETELGIWSLKNYLSDVNLRSIDVSRLDFLSKSIYAYSTFLTKNLKRFPDLLTQSELSEIKLYLKFAQRVVELFDRQFKMDLNRKVSSLAHLEKVTPIRIPSDKIQFQSWDFPKLRALPKFKIQSYIQQISSENLSHLLPVIVGELKTLFDHELTDYVIQSIQTLTKKIHPLELSKLTPKEKEKTIESLYEISKILFSSSIENKRGYLILPEKYLSMLKISDLLSRLLTKEQIEALGFDSLSFLFMGFEKTAAPSFFFFDPETLIEYERIKKNLQERGFSFEDIPRLFDTASSAGYSLEEESKLVLSNKYDFEKPETKSFLRDVLVQSISKQLKRVDSQSQLWDLVGSFLKKHQGDLLDFSKQTNPISTLWKTLIHQALMMERFSSYYLVSRGRYSRNPQPSFLDNLFFHITVKKQYISFSEYLYFLSILNKPEDNPHSLYYIQSAIENFTSSSYRSKNLKSLLFKQNADIEYRNKDSFFSPHLSLTQMELEAAKAKFPSHVLAQFKNFDDSEEDSDKYFPTSRSLGGELKQVPKYDKLRIYRALAFFENPHNMANINELESYTLFAIFLTADPLLLEEFSRDVDGPLLAKRLALFIKNNFEKAVLKENVQLAAFFSSLNHSLSSYYALAQPKLKIPFETFDPISQIKPLLSSTSRSELDLALAYGQFFMFRFQKGLKKASDVRELIGYYLKYTSLLDSYESSLPGKSKSNHQLNLQHLNIQHALFQLSPLLEHLIEENPTLISAAIKTIYPNSSLTDRWEIDPDVGFPYYICRKKELSLDLLNGVLKSLKGEEFTGSLPKIILSNEIFISLFGPNQFEAKKIGESTYEFVDDLANLYRVKTQKGYHLNELLIKMIAKGKEFFLLDPGTLSQHYKQNKLPIPNLSLFEQYRAWASSDGSILFVDPLTQKHVFYYDSLSSEGVIHLDSGDTLLDPLDTPLSFLSGFEHTHFINLLARKGVSSSQGAKVNSVEFPRLLCESKEPLKFERLNSELHCISFPNHYLSSRKGPFYQKIDPVLILENAAKKPVLALMVPHYFGSSSTSLPDAALKTSTSLDKSKKSPEVRFQLLEYDLAENPDYQTDPSQQQYLFFPRSREGALYLAFSYLRLHEYQKAYETLLSLKSNIAKFNENELKAVSAILGANQYNLDHSPQFYSVVTLLSYILLNQNEINMLPPDLISKAAVAYEKYLGFDTYNNLLALNPYEELMLIESLGKISSAFLGRYKYLSEVIDFSSTDMPSSIQIHPPQNYNLIASSDRISRFLSHLRLKNLTEKKNKELEKQPFISKDYFLSLPVLGSLLNFFIPTSSSHYYPSSIYLPEFILTLYKIARENKTLETAQLIDLKKYLLFLKNIPNQRKENLPEILNCFADFLWVVMQKPDAFPSTDDFHLLIDPQPDDTKAAQRVLHVITKEVYKILSEAGNEIISSSAAIDLGQVPPPIKGDYKKFTRLENSPPSLPLTNLKPQNENELRSIFNSYNFSSSAPESTRYSRAANQMLQVFSIEHEDRYDQVAFDQVKRDCELYLEKHEEVTANFNLSSEALLLKQAQEKNKLLLSNQKQLVARLKQEALELANKKGDNAFESEIDDLEKIAKKNQKISLQNLLILFQKQSLNSYSSANSFLSTSEIEQLNAKVAQYLVEANFLQKLHRLEKSIQRHLENISKHNPSPNAFQKLFKTATSQRVYDISQNPSYLVYEHFANIELYPKQVEKLKELQLAIETQSSPEKIGLIIEAIMGFGKSMVMLPLLSLHISNLGRLPLMVMPDSLIESLGSEIMGTLQPLQKQINVVEIARSSECHLQELQILYVKLKQALENQQTLIFSSKSLQVLFLKYIEFFNSIKTVDDTSAKIITVFQEIFKILKHSAIPIFDEADLLFNCRHETHFSLNNPIPIEDNHIMISSLLYKLILQNADEIPFNFDFLKFDPYKDSLSVSKYHQELKPYLLEKLLEQLLSGLVFKPLNLKNWIDQLEDKKLLHSYLMGVQSQEMDAFIEGIENEKIAHVIALAQAQLNLFLPMTINKKLLEHYGVTQNNGRCYAIPYQHGKASKQSEFGNPYETINYSIQTYLQQGIPREITDKELKILSDELLELSTQMPGVNLEEFNAYQKMLSIYPLLKGFHLTENVLKEANEYINQNSSEKLRFIQNYILPTIKTYTQRISSNAQTFRMMFNKLIGFTGTMWNAETYPEGLEVTPAEGIIGNTLTQFVKKSQDVVQLVVKEEDSFEHLSRWIQGKNIKAWIDLSGHFDFMPRLNVVKKILEIKRDQGIMGVAFYDEDDELMVLHDPNLPPVPFALSPLKNKPDKRFTLYDHQRTTGADVSQSDEARAVITVGKHLILRDLAQAAWRMRGLEKNQAVDFITTAADKQAMLSLLNLPENHTLTVIDVIQYAILNQQHKKASDNLLSQKQKLVSIMQEHVFKLLTDQSKTADEVYNIFVKFKKLFVQNISDAPREQFGYPETLQSTKQILYDFIHHLALIYAPLFEEEWGEINKKMEKVISLDIMPEKMPARKPVTTTALEQNIEVKLKQEIQSHVEREVEENYQVEETSIKCKIKDYIDWKKGVFEAFSAPLDLEQILQNKVYFKPRETKFYKKYKDWEADYEAVMATYEALEILPYQHYLPEAKKFFTSNTLIEKGLISINEYTDKEHVNSLCTDRCKEVLCFNTSEGLKMIMLTGKSAMQWKEYIQACDDQNSAPTTNASFLVNLDTGVIELPNDSNLLDQANKIMETNEYKILKLQTKILSGSIFFKHDEITLLSSWIEENEIDKDKLRQFILDHTIRYYPDQVLNFKASSLHRLLVEDEVRSIKV